jgi:activator of the mannose operon, transcriptional antiterminator
MAKEIIEIAERVLQVKLSGDKMLLNGLILHLRPTINRLKYGLNLRNPILNEIKENYPDIYGAAWMTSVVFEKYLGIKIKEEEIGYICLHLGASVERNKHPLRAFIVCASGIGTSQLIAARIERAFRQIEIKDVISATALRNRDLNEVDLVISTVPVEVDKPLLVISPLLKENDIKKIEIFINTGVSPDSKDTAIGNMCQDLVRRGYVTEEYTKSVFERERTAITAVGGGVAIPHGSPGFVNKSCIALTVLESPIDWVEGEEQVDIIFMICINEQEVENSGKIFRNFYNKISEDDFLEGIRSSKDKKRVYEILEGLTDID